MTGQKMPPGGSFGWCSNNPRSFSTRRLIYGPSNDNGMQLRCSASTSERDLRLDRASGTGWCLGPRSREVSTDPSQGPEPYVAQGVTGGALLDRGITVSASSSESN